MICKVDRFAAVYGFGDVDNRQISSDVFTSSAMSPFELWAKGKYFPVFYTRPKIESVTEEKLLLTPG